MFKKISTDEYFEIIKENHKRYLDGTMVTHLAVVPGARAKKMLIESYITHIKAYHQVEAADLQYDITGPTAAEKVGRGTFSALLGMGIGALVFAAEQKTPSADVFGVKTAVQGGFAATIGVSCSALIYKVWAKSTENPSVAELEAFENDMEKAGFSKKKYAKLAEDLVKLFHFRECLLLGLENKSNVNMRTAFKNRFPGVFSDLDCNIAIEVFFLQQLNDLFQEAFQDIYQIHDKEIKDEQSQPKFVRWFRRHFESEKTRRKFTQQMQIDFMNQCLRFLEQEKDSKGFMGRHPYFTASLVGLIAGSIALGVFAATLTVIPLLGLIGIGIVIACIAAVSQYCSVTKIEALFYVRDKNNREAIGSAIASIARERKRLSDLVQQVVPTTNKDLADLKKFDDQDKSSFLKILQLKGQQHIALGGVRAWVRELTSRFQESKFIEIDLSDRVKSIINDAHLQTENLQKGLLSVMSSSKPSKSDLETLNKFINDTRQYLLNPENAAFIKTFEYTQKIKEQILEIVGHIPFPLTSSVKFPENLLKFYVDPVAAGGVGGLLTDFDQIRRLSPVVPDHLAADGSHPFNRLLETAFTINVQLNAASNPSLIIRGDLQYRKMLGLPPDYFSHIDAQITIANVESYLTASFDFLCTLNRYEPNATWDKPFPNSDEFILYRMLLVKELANLVDPNNTRVDELVKAEVKTFAREKLNCNPNIAFDDVLNQALLIKRVKADEEEGFITDPLGRQHCLTDLAYLADAVRVDIAYVSTPLTPKDLLYFEATHFISQGEDKIIVGYNASGKLIPEYSDNFLRTVNTAIADTTSFLHVISSRDLLKQTGTLRIYIQVIFAEIAELKRQIAVLIQLPKESLKLNVKNLETVLAALETFKQKIPVIEAPSVEVNPTKMNETRSSGVIPVPVSRQGSPVPPSALPEIRIMPDNPHAEVISRPSSTKPLSETITVSGAANVGLMDNPVPSPIITTAPVANEANFPLPSLGSSTSPKPVNEGALPNHAQRISEPSSSSLGGFFPGNEPKKGLTAQLLEAFIRELQQFVRDEAAAREVENKKEGKGHGIFPVHHHHHTREEKINAANALIEALEKEGKGEAVVWQEKAIYQGSKANSHLEQIVSKYLKKLGAKDLASLFKSEQSLSLANGNLI